MCLHWSFKIKRSVFFALAAEGMWWFSHHKNMSEEERNLEGSMLLLVSSVI